MEELRCKNCDAGIDVRRAVGGVVKCSFCGSVFTLPKPEQDSRVLSQLGIGQNELDCYAFDRAYTAFSKAAELDSSEPEAHFGMALADFKVQYLRDRVNNKLQPVCHEINGKTFSDSSDYRRALSLATPAQKKEYTRKAEEIDYIRREFFALSKSGAAYDCFICVKSIPGERENIDPLRAAEVWNRKRIGVAVADRIDGVFERRAAPLLEPRDCSKWDCTCTTNPAVTILPSGKTYMIYKSRRYAGAPLQLGVAVAERPDGVFERLSDAPIFAFDDENIHVEDPFLWYDEARKKFCVLVKDDSKNGVFGITGEWGSGFYAESDDCVHFSVPKNSKVYSRTVRWQNGRTAIQCNLERPWILFDAKNRPARLFCATGNGSAPYAFEGNTYIISFDFNTR